MFKGTPEIREHYIDSKKDVDRHLKSACEQFIQQQTKQFIEQLEEFTTKVQTCCMFVNLTNTGKTRELVFKLSTRAVASSV